KKLAAPDNPRFVSLYTNSFLATRLRWRYFSPPLSATCCERVLPLRSPEGIRQAVFSRIPLGPGLARRLPVAANSRRAHRERHHHRMGIFLAPPKNRSNPSCRGRVATQDSPDQAGQKVSARSER